MQEANLEVQVVVIAYLVDYMVLVYLLLMPCLRFELFLPFLHLPCKIGY